MNDKGDKPAWETARRITPEDKDPSVEVLDVGDSKGSDQFRFRISKPEPTAQPEVLKADPQKVYAILAGVAITAMALTGYTVYRYSGKQITEKLSNSLEQQDDSPVVQPQPEFEGTPLYDIDDTKESIKISISSKCQETIEGKVCDAKPDIPQSFIPCEDEKCVLFSPSQYCYQDENGNKYLLETDISRVKPEEQKNIEMPALKCEKE